MTAGPGERETTPSGVSIADVREALTVDGWRGFALLRRYLRNRRDEWRAVARQLRDVRWDVRSDFASRRVGFGFVGSASTANLADSLLVESLARGIVPVQYHSASPEYSRELRDPGSGLHAHQPDIVVVAVSPTVTSIAFLDSLLADLQAFRTHSTATLLVHGFVTPEFRPGGLNDWHDTAGPGATCARLNLRLAEGVKDLADARLVDLQQLLTLAGAGWWTLHRSRFLANTAFPEEAVSVLARDYAAAGAALRGFGRKCLALDLDDTLWGGVVGEAGVDGIQIGGAYPGNIFRAIQELALRLHEGGVLLAINSHNNEDDVWEVFERRAEMALTRRHFSAWRLNWRDKSDNLRELAEQLNLGLESLVVLDNDPVQQAWIEERVPEAHVIAECDPLDMLRTLATGGLFESLGRTAEDSLRAESYRSAARRQTAETAATDRGAFLASLNLTVTVGRASARTLPRLAQMAQRTNQFNLTTRRYTEGQIAELRASPHAEVLWCSCLDRFADEGITGLAILRGPGEEWSIDTFLLSCRVLGRGVERALAAAMCRVVSARGVRRLRGEYLRTPRNAPAAEFYRDAGFAEVDSQPDRTVWQLTLPAPDTLAPSWIALRFEEDER